MTLSSVARFFCFGWLHWLTALGLYFFFVCVCVCSAWQARHEQLRKAALLNDDLISVDSEGKEHVHGKPSAEHNKQKQQKRGKRGAEGEEGTNDKKKAKKEKKKSQQKRGQKGTEPNTSRQNQNQNQKEGAGKKAGRQPRRQDADSELDAIASEGLATGGGTKANQSRRSKRNKVRAQL